MLCWFLLYNNMNQLYVYIYPLPLEPPSHPPTSHPSRISQSTKLSSLCCIAASHQLSTLHMVVYICQCYSLNSSHSPFPAVSTSPSLLLHLYSCPANRFICTIFLDFILCVNIQYLFFSFWLTSLCITGSRFIHLTSTDSNLFLFIVSDIPLWASMVVQRLRIHLPM